MERGKRKRGNEQANRTAWQDLPRLGQQRLAVEHATNQGLNLSPHWPCVCTTLPPIFNAYVFVSVCMIECVTTM
ncbi:unnamed protein product [Leuciscus chuanchicus]